MIDAGHDFYDVLCDARYYGPMATKYIIFHDICLPEVEAAVTHYQRETGLKLRKVINSPTFGYGIMEIQ
jgi:hypothetical protein